MQLKTFVLPTLYFFFLTGLATCKEAHARIPQTEYDALIESARKGAVAPAIKKLEEWLTANPQNDRVVYDLVTLKDQAGQHGDVIQYARLILVPATPSYALKAFGHSARMINRPQEAEAAYQLVLKKTPNDTEALAGLAYVRMTQNRFLQARDHIVSHLPKVASRYTRRDFPLLVALAELHERQGDWLLAASVYQDVLRLDPGFRYALRGRVFALERADAPYLAKRLADSAPEAFNAEEKRRLAHAAAAQLVGLGRAQAGIGEDASRFSTTDRALAQSAQVLREFGPAATTQFDRLVALRDRGRMTEAVELHQALVASNVRVRAYAKAAAADAYLYLQRPEMARDLYLEALADTSAAGGVPDPEWQFSLLYAYSEAEQHDEALALADRMLKETPLLSPRSVPGIERSNPAYVRAALMAALVRLYADRPQEAEARLKLLLERAPDNQDVRAAWASLQAARGRPRAALDEFMVLQVDSPASITAALGRGNMLLALNEYGAARSILPPLLETSPERRSIQDFARRIDLYGSPQLRVETNIGRGAEAAGAESVFDAALYSAALTETLGERYRVFTHVSRSQSTIRSAGPGNADGDFVPRTRGGVGVNYRSQAITAEAQVNRAVTTAAKTGLAAAVAWTPNDPWSARAVLDTNVNDLPPAAFRERTTGKLLKLEASWSAKEARRIGGDISHLRFSDGNNRNAGQAWWTERWVTGPVFKLDTTLGLYGSRNSARDRPYFNPTRDRQASVSARAEWLTARRYARSFRQRVIGTGGMYWQEGFDRGRTGDLRYEHEWSGSDAVALRYGVGRSVHPYDGNPEGRNYGYFVVNWVIQ
jgi:biofilm PGA synthesis protein PgaA